MHRLVIFTVVTSLLTNEIEDEDPKKWILDLNETAKWTQAEIEKSSDYSHISSQIIVPLRNRLEKKLNNSDMLGIPEMSADLNGIYGLYYGLYDEQFSKGNPDMHFLIATDTPQGQVTAKIVNNFL
jgi:CRISPR/Cas system-associated protein Csm6